MILLSNFRIVELRNRIRMLGYKMAEAIVRQMKKSRATAFTTSANVNGDRLFFVKDKMMLMPKMPKENNNVKP